MIKTHELFNNRHFQRTTTTTTCPSMGLAPCDLKVSLEPQSLLQATMSYHAHATDVSKNNDGNVFAQLKIPTIIMEIIVNTNLQH